MEHLQCSHFGSRHPSISFALSFLTPSLTEPIASVGCTELLPSLSLVLSLLLLEAVSDVTERVAKGERERERLRVSERKREGVGVRERKRASVCVREREKRRSVRKRERERQGTERERESASAGGIFSLCFCPDAGKLPPSHPPLGSDLGSPLWVPLLASDALFSALEPLPPPHHQH